MILVILPSFIRKYHLLGLSPPKNLITDIQYIPSYVNQILYITLVSFTDKNKHHESSVKKLIIDSGVMDHFIIIYACFSIYKEYYHVFQTDFKEILTAHGYGDVVLYFANLDYSKVTWRVKKSTKLRHWNIIF